MDIIYKPVKSPEKKKFSVSTLKTYQNHTEILTFFARDDKQKRHIENCSGVPKIIYDLNYKNLITFEDNFKSKGIMPMAMNFDFEKTAPTHNCFNPEQKNCLLCLMF